MPKSWDKGLMFARQFVRGSYILMHFAVTRGSTSLETRKFMTKVKVGDRRLNSYTSVSALRSSADHCKFGGRCSNGARSVRSNMANFPLFR